MCVGGVCRRSLGCVRTRARACEVCTRAVRACEVFAIYDNTI